MSAGLRSQVRQNEIGDTRLVNVGRLVPRGAGARVVGRRFGAALVIAVAVSAIGLNSARASAADTLRDSTSLAFIPEDAAAYSASFRLKEQFQALANSRAVAKILSLPAVKTGLGQLVEQFHSDPDSQQFVQAFLQFWNAPENKQLAALLGDAVSNEVFFYSDQSLIELARKFQRLNLNANIAAFQTQALQGNDQASQEQALRMLTEVLGNIELPNFVLGFRLSATEPAVQQLARLEQFATAAAKEIPALDGRIRREKIGEQEYVTLTLDGSQIPWNEIKEDSNREIIDAIAEKLKDKKFVVSLGLRKNFLLLSFGGSNAHLAKLGGKKLLVDRPELAPVVKAAGKPLTSIGYVSEDMSRIVDNSAGQFEQVVEMVQKGLDSVGLDPDGKLKAEIAADFKMLERDLAKMIPEPSAVTTYSYRTPRGGESFSYRWKGKSPSIDGSKPLTILNHVGGDPLVVVAGREKVSAEGYDTFIKYAKRIGYYADKLIVPQLDEQTQVLYSRALADLAPLAARFDKTTREKYIPALADGQSAFVLDAKTARTSWHPLMTESKKPLPIPEISLVWGVSDAGLLKQAAAEYFALVQDLFNTIRNLAPPDTIPPIVIPGPDRHQVDSGELFVYEIPGEVGIPEEIGFCAGLGKDVAVLAYVPQQAERILKSTPLAATGVLTRRNEPAASATYVNLAGIIDAVRPWIEYAFQGETDPDTATTLEIVSTVLDAIHCFRSFSSITYFEGPAQVTFSETQIVDLE